MDSKLKVKELVDEVNSKFSLSFTRSNFVNFCFHHGLRVTSSRKCLPPGDQIIRSGLVYVIQKDGSMKNKAVLIYEAVDGPIDKDGRVIFLDKDATNFSLDNLFLITSRELGYLSRAMQLTDDPKQTLLNIQYYRTRVKLKAVAKELGLLAPNGMFKSERNEYQNRYPKEKRRENSRRYRQRLKENNPEKYREWVKQTNAKKRKKNES